MKKHLSYLVRWTRVALVIAALLVPGAAVQRTGAAPAKQPVPPGALAAEDPVPAGTRDKVAQTPAADRSAYPKLQSQLAALYESVVLGTGRPPETFAGQRHIDLAADTARVILEMDVDPKARQTGPAQIETVALEGGRTARIEHAPPIAIRSDLAAAIAATGAGYETAYETWVQVLAPFASLPALSRLDGVRLVRLPLAAYAHQAPQTSGDQPVPQVGTQTTEGVGLTNANTWLAGGYDGTGVNVAVFDFGFTGWATRQSGGDLPSGVVTHDFSSAYSFSPDTSGYDHGTACAEIAYDMAPGATIHLYAWDTEVQFGNAVTDYRANVSGKRVATMSIGWLGAGPYDGTGSINTVIDNAQASGIFWANSAGNYQKQHYSGTAVQYGTTDYVTFGSNDAEEFGSATGTYYNLYDGVDLSAYLSWNDWNAARDGNTSGQDYDMELQRSPDMSAWTTVATSTERQCGNSGITPVEGIEYTTPSYCSTQNCYYRLRVYRYTGCTNDFGHWLSLFSGTGSGTSHLWWDSNDCNSLAIPADSDSAVAVGATFWGEDGTSPLYGLETFSSLGPRNASGGANPGSAVNKPDVVAPDGVSTATYGASDGISFGNGGSGFWGTSGATPHVAGLAASAWEGYPAYTPAELRSYVQVQAVYKAAGSCGGTLGGRAAPEGATQSNSYGWGRIRLGTPPTSGPLPPDKAPQCLDNAAGTVAQDAGAPTMESAASTTSGGTDLMHAMTTFTTAELVAPQINVPVSAEEVSAPEPEATAQAGANAPVVQPMAGPEAVSAIANIQLAAGNSSFPNDERYVSMDSDSAGNLYVAYEMLKSGSNYDLVVGKSADNGLTWQLLLLYATDDPSERYPALTVDDGGYIWIAYEYDSGSGFNPGYWKTTSSGDIGNWTGTRWTGVNGSDTPVIDVLGSGSTALVYLVCMYSTGGYKQPFWLYSADGGSIWNGPYYLNRTVSGSYPTVAISSYSGSTYVNMAWQEYAYGSTSRVARSYCVNNGTWITPVTFAGGAAYPDMGSTGSNVYLVYQDYFSSSNDDVLFRYSTTGGSTGFDTAYTVAASTSVRERYPAVSASADKPRVAYFNGTDAVYLELPSAAYGTAWANPPYQMDDATNAPNPQPRYLDVAYRYEKHPAVAWSADPSPSAADNVYYSTLDNPATAPALSWPDNGATLQAYAPMLTWGASTDGDGDTVRYWWYVDTASPPTTKIGGPVGSATLFSQPYYTTPGSAYYWKVQADDGYVLTDSAAGSFTTAYDSFSGSPATYTELFSTDPGTPTGTRWTRKAFACLDCFEAEPIRWTVSPGGTWERSAAYASSGVYSAHSLYDANSVTYNMTSPALDLRGSAWAFLNSHWRGSSEAGYDYLYLQTSPDGNTWTTLDARTGTGYSAQWWKYFESNIDLSSFGTLTNGRARFSFVTNASTISGEGWYEDDVEVSRASEWSWQSADSYYRLQTTGAFVGYTNNLVDQFYSPFIRLDSSGPISLYLRERFIISSGDTGSIWILDTTTGIWERLDSFSGTETNWVDFLLRIPDTYLGKTVVVALILRSDGTGTLGSPDETGGYWDIDTFRLEMDPTSVVLKSFKARPEAPAMLVRWETAQEIDNLGFNLYRSNTRNGPKLKLNQELIPTKVPPGSPFGAVYDYIDGFRLRSGRAYFYWLEDVDLHGDATVHGPVRVLFP